MYLSLSESLNFDLGDDLSRRDICIVDRQTDELTRLTTDRQMSSPAWSQIGLQLAWLRANDSVGIWDMTTAKIEYFHSPVQFHSVHGRLEWSKDGTRIYVQGDGAILEIAQNVFIPLSQPPRSTVDCCATWSSNEGYLAYMEVVREDTNGSHWQIRVLQDGKAIITGEFETNLDQPLQWSTDGTTLAWVADTSSGSQPPQYKLALSRVPENKTTYLATDNVFVAITGIAWSPTGNKIAIRKGDLISILELEIDMTSSMYHVAAQQNIPLQGTSFGGLSWSPDGKTIAYESSWQPFSHIWLAVPDDNAQKLLPGQ